MAGTAKNGVGPLAVLTQFHDTHKTKGKGEKKKLDGWVENSNLEVQFWFAVAENVRDGNKVCATRERSGEQMSCLTRFSSPRSRAATIE